VQGLAPENMPVRVCIAAAQEVSAILAEYVDDLGRLPCDLIFPIVLAAATLWQHRGEYKAGPDRAKVQEQIDLCVKCLSIMGKFWKNAGDCRRKLIRGECRAFGIFRPAIAEQVVIYRFRWCCLNSGANDT
jgi:hypothetical protein